ncbi:DUF1963 domain-containing protein [Tropicibacter sp. S64]|uniref:DUF1963 domain-containing protein n=1 Tax=Tropicibacter sp. S64 TaxID=3415122 RepID=UPI003C7E007E
MNDSSEQEFIQQQLEQIESWFREGRITKERYELTRTNFLAQFDTVSDEEYFALRDAARRPALLLDKMPRPDMPGAPGCWLGGLPTLPSDIAWPWFTYHGRPLAPMHFVAQIDLAQLPNLEGLPARSTTGTLFFFVSPILNQLLDGNGCGPKGHVFYVAGDVSRLAPRPMPAFPDFADFPNLVEGWEVHYEETRTTSLDRWNIGFRPFENLERVDDRRTAVTRRIGEEQSEIMDALSAEAVSRLAGATRMTDYAALHRMFGLCMGSPRTPDPTDAKSGKCRLLLLDWDADIGYYDYLTRWTSFWIGRDDLEHGRFERAFLEFEGA